MKPFDETHVDELLATVFAPWINELGLKVESHSPDQCRFVMPKSAHIVRQTGPGGDPAQAIVCGQALAAAADTVSVLALALINGELRPNTTTEFSIRFLRPIPIGDVRIEVRPLSNGRRLASTEVFFFAEGSTKPGCHATCGFAWLDQ